VLDKLAYVVRAQQHKAGTAATIVMLLLIARLTLYPSVGPLPSGFHRCILCGEYGLADFIDNVILFVPLGFALRLAGMRRWSAWLLTAAMAVGIETAQDWVIPGRESSLSDIISNPLGGAIGIALADMRVRLLAPSATTARRLSTAAAVAITAFAAVMTWGLARAVPKTGAYWTQVGSRLPQYVPFQGSILHATIDHAPIGNGPLDSATEHAIRAALRDGTARIDIQMVPRARTERIAPLVTIYDQWHNEIVAVGCRRDRIVFRTRIHARNLRLHPVSFEVPGGCVTADTTSVTVQPLPRGTAVRFTTVSGTRRIETTVGTGVWLAWHLLVPNDGWWSKLSTAFTILWMAGLFVPLAYWRARLERARGRPDVSLGRVSAGSALLIATVLVVTLVVLPLAAGSIVAPPIAWLGAVGGAAIGWFLAQWSLDSGRA
jgi:hypothetical protein